MTLWVMGCRRASVGITTGVSRREDHERDGSMNVQRRDFLLLVTLVTAAATAAFTKTEATAAEPAAVGNQSGASFPDFSSVWGHHTSPETSSDPLHSLSCLVSASGSTGSLSDHTPLRTVASAMTAAVESGESGHT
jgi:hypothetical protein